MRIQRWLLRSALPLLAAGLLVGCGDDGGLTDSDTGTLSLLLTDAPGDFTTATVTISEVYLQGEGEDGERVVLMDEAVTTDLLTLANDVATLVEDAVVPAGTYSQLRFIVPGACIEVEGENDELTVYASSGYTECGAADGTLQMPSFEQTGIKVNLPGGSVEITGEQQVLLVDFDVSQSFGQQAGQSGMWVMTPVVNATDFSATGGVDVTVDLADSVTLPTVGGEDVTLADFRAVLTNADGGEEKAELADGDGDGVFDVAFEFLAPGDYQVSLEEPDSVSVTTDPATPVDVSVPSGQDVSQALTVTSAEKQGGGAPSGG